MLFLSTTTAFAAGNSFDPDVAAYNLRLGSQAFGARYHFTTNDLVIEEAEHLLKMGSDIVKFSLGPGKGRKRKESIAAYVKTNPTYTRLFSMPFRHYFAWTGIAGHNSQNYWRTGSNPDEDRREYDEIYELTQYLLTKYSGTGKRFYLGNWEGDWLLLGPARDGDSNPPNEAVLGMRAWLNARQKAVDDAKRATPHTNVDVFVYVEVNRVRDAMQKKAGADIRVVNAVLPFVANIDYVSYSSYDSQTLKESELVKTLDYIEAHTPKSKASMIPGRRVFIGEYGFGKKTTPEQQLEPTREYLARVLSWGVPFALFWQVYNNEENSYFCLIDERGKPTPCYELHKEFLSKARLRVAEFKRQKGRLPTDAEFTALATSLLGNASTRGGR